MHKQTVRSVVVVMLVAASTVLPAAAQGAQSTRDAAIISPLSSCTIISDKQPSVQVRVGPGPNRSVLQFLAPSRTLSVEAVTTMDDGAAWFKLNKAEVDANSAAAELWIDAAEVTQFGNCEDMAMRFDPTPVLNSAQITVRNPESGSMLTTLVDSVNTDNLMNTIETLQGFTSRHVNSVQTSVSEGVAAAANYLHGEFVKVQDASGGNFRGFMHPFTAYYNGVQSTQNNIVGVINGSDPSLPAIVIGAHYDSRTDDLTDSRAFAPGADDNGSGVAGILELARIMSQTRPHATVIFVLFAAEEVSRQGSIAFVRDYIQGQQVAVRVMINVDTIGSTQDPYGNVNDRELRIFSKGQGDSPSRDMARMIHLIVETFGTDLTLRYVEEIDRPGRYGDHFSFNEAGYPAIRIIEALEDTPHREGRDTIEFIEPEYLTKSVRTLATILLVLSDSEAVPTSVVVQSAETGVLRVSWQPVENATGYLVALRNTTDSTFVKYFFAASNEIAWDCACFARYSSISVAALNANGIGGLLSPAVSTTF